MAYSQRDREYNDVLMHPRYVEEKEPKSKGGCTRGTWVEC
jgi:hypothetical protein